VLAEALDRRVVVGLVDVQRVVNVHTSAPAGKPNLRHPETDSGPRPGHQPDAIVLPSSDHGKTEHSGVEPLGCLEIEHLEDELVDAGNGNPGHDETIIATVLLETERLVLRRPQPGDLDDFAALFADPEVVRYTGGVTKSRLESELAIERMIDHWERHEIGLFSLVRKEDERVIGRAGFLIWDSETWVHAMLREPHGPTETEIGWTLGREFWGRGYATEAAIAARDWALRDLRLRRLISLIQTGNDASVRVAEKLGETLEREDLPGPFQARTDLYALTVLGPAR
jgi:ribosomal-protein-alanine N-acetyltransferase